MFESFKILKATKYYKSFFFHEEELSAFEPPPNLMPEEDPTPVLSWMKRCNILHAVLDYGPGATLVVLHGVPDWKIRVHTNTVQIMKTLLVELPRKSTKETFNIKEFSYFNSQFITNGFLNGFSTPPYASRSIESHVIDWMKRHNILHAYIVYNPTDILSIINQRRIKWRSKMKLHSFKEQIRESNIHSLPSR